MVILSDGDKTSKLLTVKKTAEKYVKSQRHDTSHYSYEGLYLLIDQVADPNFSQLDVEDKHCTDLAESMSLHGFDYVHGITIVF